MLLLAFDTATPAITAAVHDGSTVVGIAEHDGAMAHGELLVPTIHAALRQAGAAISDVTDIAVGVGPGPFTGLRVGVVTALTLVDALGATAHGVCTLDILAGAVESGAVESRAVVDSGVVGSRREFIVASDARRREVYWARYGADGTRLEGPSVDKPAVVAGFGLPVVGRGAALYELDGGGLSAPTDPHAATLADLVVGGRVERWPLVPLYLRRPDAKPQVQLG